jgi:hypothetical protein
MTGLVLICALASFINFAVHGVMTGLIVFVTRHTAVRTEHLAVYARLAALLTVTVVALMIGHVAEIAIWAAFYSRMDVMPENVTALEFAFENYTALGYGDAVPKGGGRLIGPITALNGLLLIGWSVAIIFEVMRMAEVQIGRPRKRDR